MDNRRVMMFLALVLLFIGLQNLFFPPKRPEPPAQAVPAAVAPGAPRTPQAAAPAFTASAVEVRSPLYRYTFSTRGGALTGAQLLRFESYVKRGERVELVPAGVTDLFAHRVVMGSDTVDLRGLEFRPNVARIDLAEGSAPQRLTFTAQGPAGIRADLTYTFRADDYLVDVQGRISGLRPGARLITSLGTGLAPHDAKEHQTERELAAVAWNGRRVELVPYRKLAGVDTIAGPLRWVGVKDRYFLYALIATGQTQFERTITTDAPDLAYRADGEDRVAPRASTIAVMPLGADGSFIYQAYPGPLEHGRLVRVGHELEEVNPYGYRWLRPVIRPVAQVVLWALNKMHDEFGLAYGLVLILFGLIVRVITWPLNARAMRSQMKNMAMQPELQRRMEEIKQKYPDDMQAQHHATLEMYKEIGFSPFSTMSGCLPMLIPWPVLLTLFFVFQGAIEFRGASFAWLPDLSLKDPFFVLPVLLVVSMFGLQWISTKLSGVEQNEQMKMMMYMMPLMMGFVFWWFPSGLNLYYVSQNIASLPQQILIAQERRKAMEEKKAEDAAKAAAEARLRPAPSKPKKKR